MANPKFKVTQEQIDLIVKLRLEGRPKDEIARTLGISKHTVTKYTSINGIKLTKEQRVVNVDKGKRALLGDNYLDEMRSHITREVELERADTLRKRYLDPVNREVLSIANLKKWNERDEEFKKQHVKRLHKDLHINYLKEYGAASETEVMELHISNIGLGGSFIGPYVDTETSTEWKCAEGHIFNRTPAEVRGGRWCKVCSLSGSSKGQREVLAFIRSITDKEVIDRARGIFGDKREVDIYVPELKFALEYNGLYYHSEEGPSFKKNAARDKAADCHRLGISLFTIYEDEWLNDDKRNLIKSMIRVRLGKFEGQKLFARKLEVKKLDKNKDFRDFFNKYHLDGNVNAKYGYGLYYNNILVMCLSVRRKEGVYEIARMATHIDYLVVGGAGKLIEAVKKDIPNNRLISYSNNRIGMGEVYRKVGGIEITQSKKPSFYFTDGVVRLWRSKCEIDKALPGTGLEQAHAGLLSFKYFGDNRPLYAIEDCGHKKWLLQNGIAK